MKGYTYFLEEARILNVQKRVPEELIKKASKIKLKQIEFFETHPCNKCGWVGKQCCSNCFNYEGYYYEIFECLVIIHLTNLSPKQIYDKLHPLFTSTDGFWDKGCKIPRLLRSNTCTRFSCMSSFEGKDLKIIDSLRIKYEDIKKECIKKSHLTLSFQS